jgi:DNA-binding Lrp family transcriptional regulator
MGFDLHNEVDEIDLKIVKLLQEDSRLSLRKMADQLGVAAGTVYNHIKNLEYKGVLKGYTVVVDPVKLGYSLTAIILIRAEGAHLTDVEENIAKIDNVVSVYDITGDFDIAVVARFMGRSDLNSFIKSLLTMPYVDRTVTNVVLNVVKEEFRVHIT